MATLFANTGDPDQTAHTAASDLGLHCLSMVLLGVSRLKWVKIKSHLRVAQNISDSDVSTELNCSSADDKCSNLSLQFLMCLLIHSSIVGKLLE